MRKRQGFLPILVERNYHIFNHLARARKDGREANRRILAIDERHDRDRTQDLGRTEPTYEGGTADANDSEGELLGDIDRLEAERGTCSCSSVASGS